MNKRKGAIIGVGTARPVEVTKVRKNQTDVQLLIPEFINYPLKYKNKYD